MAIRTYKGPETQKATGSTTVGVTAIDVEKGKRQGTMKIKKVRPVRSATEKQDRLAAMAKRKATRDSQEARSVSAQNDRNNPNYQGSRTTDNSSAKYMNK